MFAKITVITCVLAVASAGYLEGGAVAYESYAEPAYASGYAAPAYASGYAAPALAATSDNVYRSPGNLHSISTQSRTIATPFSSSNKHFTSVSNPGIYAHAAPVATYAHAAPVATYAHAAPVASYAHAAPVATYAAAAPIPSHTTYTASPLAAAGYATGYAAHAAPIASTYAAAAPIATGYAAGGYSAGLGYAAGQGYGYGAAIGRSAHPSGLLGVAYSPAVAVSHMSYSSPVGINYSW